MSRLRGLVLAATLTFAAPAAAQPIGSGVAPVCDRACMTAMIDRYLAALVAHDPGALPLNCDVKFTENSARLKVGSEGLWIGASELPTGPRIYVIDVGAGQAGFYGVMKERDKPLLLALRLKVVNSQITQIEHVIARSIRADALANLAQPRPELTASLAPAERLSRWDQERLGRIAVGREAARFPTKGATSMSRCQRTCRPFGADMIRPLLSLSPISA